MVSRNASSRVRLSLKLRAHVVLSLTWISDRISQAHRQVLQDCSTLLDAQPVCHPTTWARFLAGSSRFLFSWVGLRVDYIGGIFAAILTAYSVYTTRFNASEIGFLLNMTLLNTELILHWVRCMNDVEVEGNRYESLRVMTAIR